MHLILFNEVIETGLVIYPKHGKLCLEFQALEERPAHSTVQNAWAGLESNVEAGMTEHVGPSRHEGIGDDRMRGSRSKKIIVKDVIVGGE